MCTCTQRKMRETPEYNTYQCKTAGKYAFVRKTCEKRDWKYTQQDSDFAPNSLKQSLRI